MYDFVFQNSTRILFGKKTISSVGTESSSFGRKILFVYGKQSIHHNGIYEKVTQSLCDANISIIEHSGITPNPTLDHARQGITTAKKNAVDAIVAVGGGSVMDTGKAIAAGTLVDHDVWKFFIGKKKVNKVLPVICIPTLAGSGSEMNAGMVITHHETHQKFGFANRHLYPKVSILDPCTTFSVSPSYTAYGAVDIIIHLLESYFTSKLSFSPLQDRFKESLIATVIESCNTALENPQDYASRANLMWCAALALSGYPVSGLGKIGFPTHLIEHSLSGLYDTPHGAGLSVILLGWLRFKQAQLGSKLARLGKHIFPQETVCSAEKNSDVIDSFCKWFTRIGCPVTLQDMGIHETDITRIASHTLSLAKVWRMKEYNQQEIEKILQLCR